MPGNPENPGRDTRGASVGAGSSPHGYHRVTHDLFSQSDIEHEGADILEYALFIEAVEALERGLIAGSHGGQ